MSEPSQLVVKVRISPADYESFRSASPPAANPGLPWDEWLAGQRYYGPPLTRDTIDVAACTWTFIVLPKIRKYQSVSDDRRPAIRSRSPRGPKRSQVGYWLWEPATKTVVQTLAIPRAQVALASGMAEPDARRFTVRAKLGSPTFGICSAPFLNENFQTVEYTITVTLNADGTLAYEQDTVLQIAGRPEPFHHTDKNTLRKVGEARPNPLMR